MSISHSKETKRILDQNQTLQLLRNHLAITILDTAHIHEMHEGIARGEFEPHTADKLRRLIVLIDNTPWWAELEGKAKELGTKMTELISAIQAKSATSSENAGEVHGLCHSLVRDFYSLLPEKSEA